MRPGVVQWIGLRPARRAAMVCVDAAVLAPGEGVVGDRYRNSATGARQVTVMQVEHLSAIAGYLGMERVEPEQLRRNFLVSGINLLALKGGRFRLGPATLEATGECHPCSRMEEILGVGGYNAVRGHGGITARVVSGGKVRVGDGIERD